MGFIRHARCFPSNFTSWGEIPNKGGSRIEPEDPQLYPEDYVDARRLRVVGFVSMSAVTGSSRLLRWFPAEENFSDENCLNGLIMPLKLPPRLQRNGNNGISSHKSPRPVRKLPSALMSSWDDGFDPFMVAWQKVRNEDREENTRIRLSRLHSPFRILSKYSNNQSRSQEFDTGNSPMKQIMQVSTPNYGELKGLAYARWVREQMTAVISPRKIKNPSFFLLGRRALVPEIIEQYEQEPSSIKGEFVKENGNMKSMVGKLKELFLKPASFDRESP